MFNKRLSIQICVSIRNPQPAVSRLRIQRVKKCIIASVVLARRQYHLAQVKYHREAILLSASALFREAVLAHAAQGALKIIGQVLELCAGGNAVLGVAGGLVINPAASISNILFHNRTSPYFKFNFSFMLGYLSISVWGINLAACIRTMKSGMEANCTQ